MESRQHELELCAAVLADRESELAAVLAFAEAERGAILAQMALVRRGLVAVRRCLDELAGNDQAAEAFREAVYYHEREARECRP